MLLHTILPAYTRSLNRQFLSCWGRWVVAPSACYAWGMYDFGPLLAGRNPNSRVIQALAPSGGPVWSHNIGIVGCEMLWMRTAHLVVWLYHWFSFIYIYTYVYILKYIHACICRLVDINICINYTYMSNEFGKLAACCAGCDPHSHVTSAAGDSILLNLPADRRSADNSSYLHTCWWVPPCVWSQCTLCIYLYIKIYLSYHYILFCI